MPFMPEGDPPLIYYEFYYFVRMKSNPTDCKNRPIVLLRTVRMISDPADTGLPDGQRGKRTGRKKRRRIQVPVSVTEVLSDATIL